MFNGVARRALRVPAASFWSTFASATGAFGAAGSVAAGCTAIGAIPGATRTAGLGSCTAAITAALAGVWQALLREQRAARWQALAVDLVEMVFGAAFALAGAVTFKVFTTATAASAASVVSTLFSVAVWLADALVILAAVITTAFAAYAAAAIVAALFTIAVRLTTAAPIDTGVVVDTELSGSPGQATRSTKLTAGLNTI